MENETSKDLRAEAKKRGAIYTPESFADYVSEKLLHFFARKNKRPSFNNLKVLDPACGDGALLGAFWKKLLGKEKIAGIDPRRILCGVDISDKAALNTRRLIQSFSPRSSLKINVIATNSLIPYKKNITAGWRLIRKEFNAEEGFDLIIANPPWGADISGYKEKLFRNQFELMNGQYDSSDLFLELAISQLKESGLLAFIVPDSIFAFEREKLRRKLLTETRINYLGRFGEKIFPNINRACAVVICEKNKEQKKQKVVCCRLTPDLRRAVLDGKVTFKRAEKIVAHTVPQKRFLGNKRADFDIDLMESEGRTVQSLSSTGNTLGQLLDSSRGVELSKSGKLCKCPHCNLWMPYPVANEPACLHCKEKINVAMVKTKTIVSDKQKLGMQPLIVGENIARYHLADNYWIELGVPGINYKEQSLYLGPKILVRKTGVGLSATMDYQNSYTNQVVYIFKLKKECSDVPIEYPLAIMNSRAIYYYLSKKNGETEWRSHPYLTQKQILQLPSPNGALSVSEKRKTINLIAELARPFLRTGRELERETDALLESQIAKLFGLTKKDYEKIFLALDSAEELLPIKRLKSISLQEIFS